MKWIIAHRYTLLLLCSICLLTLGALTLTIYYNPEHMLEAEWKETGWSYEKIDTRDFVYHDVKLKRKHEAESWTFAADHVLYFYNARQVIAKATWKLKGRGHVLQVLYEDGTIEKYDIEELNDKELILNVDTGLESRGIARLVFTKVDHHQ
jgi:hypothetical protein